MFSSGRLRTAFAVVLLAVVHEGAYAQSGTGLRIGIVDVKRVFSEAAAARKVRGEMDLVRKKFEERVKEQERELREKGRKLAGQQTVLSSEEFAKRRRAFQDEGLKAQTAIRERKRQLDRAFRRTRDVIMTNLVAATRELRETLGIDVVLERGVVFDAVPSLDLTPELVKRLDARLPAVELQIEKGEGAGREER